MQKPRKVYSSSDSTELPPDMDATVFSFLNLLSGKSYVSKRRSVLIHKRDSTQVGYILIWEKYRSK